MYESDFINHSVTVMFCPPFWIALFEMHYGGQYSVAKIYYKVGYKKMQKKIIV